MIIVIGRGHSGTRAISHTLTQSGVFMGAPLNASGDLLPAEPLYDACRIMSRYVKRLGNASWNFSAVLESKPTEAFEILVRHYLSSLLESNSDRRGWKLPETTLIYPWILHMFPEAKYIIWVRDPRDCILKEHLTDDLSNFGIDFPAANAERLQRAMSWKYQYDLIEATPPPKNHIAVRFEDFVLKQEKTLARLENWLGFPLARIPVRPESVGRYKVDTGTHDFDFLNEGKVRFGYGKVELLKTD